MVNKSIERTVGSRLAETRKSILLLGPRQVGKSTLLKGLGPHVTINLADEVVLADFSGDPGALRSMVERKGAKTVFIDEVLRLPSLLNSAQVLIDDDGVRFLLSGSSARKLKTGGANLLPGRVLNFEMGPLTYAELGYKQAASALLHYGSLPGVFTETNENEKRGVLTSYAASYLQEEIRAEALTKSLEGFTRFLFAVTSCVGTFVDYTKLAKQARISRHTCPNFFEILEDTLLGYRIYPPRDLVASADLVKHPKFFLFDVGVYNGLCKDFSLGHERVGRLSEQLVFSQLFHSARAKGANLDIFSFRTRGGLEVDFLLKLDNKFIALEVKATDRILDSDVAGLVQMKKYLPSCTLLLAHMGVRESKVDSVWALPLGAALKELGL